MFLGGDEAKCSKDHLLGKSFRSFSQQAWWVAMVMLWIVVLSDEVVSS